VAGIPNYARGERLNAASVLFRARVPAIGYGSYRIEPVNDDAPPTDFPGATAKTDPDGTVILETDLYRVRIDPARGGTIASLVSRDGNREFVDAASERRFNEYRGYFVSEQKWSSADNRAKADYRAGPFVRALVSVRFCCSKITITLARAALYRPPRASTRHGSAIHGHQANRRTERRRPTRAAGNSGRFFRCRSAIRLFYRTPP
jgi:hypothetical protein